MNSKILISGSHLSPSTRAEIEKFMEKLLRHNSVIVRVRLDLHEHGSHGGRAYHTARGVVEMRGPDIIVSETSEDLFKAIHAVVDKMERRLAESTRRHREERKHPHAIDLPGELPKVAIS